MQTKKGFTLIELLVVVLIIGILAAVALPQYQKAVEKSRAMKAITLLKSVYTAQKAYHLANGTYATSLEELSIDLPGWTENEGNFVSGEWQLAPQGSFDEHMGPSVWIKHTTGPYKGTGFIIHWETQYPTLKNDVLYCYEIHQSGEIQFSGAVGDYCKKIFGASLVYPGGVREFRMP